MSNVCTEHSGLCVNIENLKEQTVSNTREIRTLSDAVIKLTILVEDCNARLKSVPSGVSGKLVFWDTTTKKYAIKLGFVLCLVVVFGLVGTNLVTNTDILNFLK